MPIILTLDDVRLKGMGNRAMRAKRIPRPAIARTAEREYAAALSKVAKHVGDIVRGFDVSNDANIPKIDAVLRRYADMLGDWAESTAERFVKSVERKDYAHWAELSREMSRDVRDEILNADTGNRVRELMEQQVRLIKSIPLESAYRVHDMTINALSNGERAASIADEIMRAGDIARNRAMLIARTESSRASTVFTQARAESVGSEGYVWTTSRDGDVRPSHKAMSGKFVRWDAPPTLDKLTGHAGCVPNCRCFPYVVIPK